VRLVFVDAWDSFAHSLSGLLGELGADVDFVRCDAVTVAYALAADGVVLGPGPGRPEDAGIYIDVVRGAAAARVPLLGVCLGHQALGLAFGARVVRHPPVHGVATPIQHEGTGLFEGLPPSVRMTRYHSLVVERDTLPAALLITASSPDGAVQGLAHRSLPMFGVQFHPESVGSGAPGRQLLANFLVRVTAERSPAVDATGATRAKEPGPGAR
jgi:anthranilate synthase/aminodeoxychorismate synthase-like glutamine amidotransferase